MNEEQEPAGGCEPTSSREGRRSELAGPATKMHSDSLYAALNGKRGSPPSPEGPIRARGRWWRWITRSVADALLRLNEITPSGMQAAQRSLHRVLARRHNRPVKVTVSVREAETSRQDPVRSAAEGGSRAISRPDNVDAVVSIVPAVRATDEDRLD